MGRMTPYIREPKKPIDTFANKKLTMKQDQTRVDKGRYGGANEWTLCKDI